MTLSRLPVGTPDAMLDSFFRGPINCGDAGSPSAQGKLFASVKE